MILNKVKAFSTTISLTLLVLTSVLKLTRLSVILSSIWLLVKPLFISGLYLFILSFIYITIFLHHFYLIITYFS